MLLALDVRDLKERELEELCAVSKLCVCCGSVEEPAILKSSFGGGVMDLGDERELESGVRDAAGVLRLVVLRLGD
jgi:hypothetical protein